MTTLVNIGLQKAHGGLVPLTHAVAALSVIGGVAPLRTAVRQSATEPTLVAELRSPLHAAAAYELARQLDQDAIAQWDGREGYLYGPQAAAWGPFDPAFFVTLDGSPLETRRAA